MLRWLPANVSTYGGQIDRLFSIIEWITGITFVLVIALLLIFIIKYRDRGGRRATYTHGNTFLEVHLDDRAGNHPDRALYAEPVALVEH